MSGERPARSRDIVIVGAGGFGRETADVIEAINKTTPGTWNLIGVYDDGPAAINLQRLEDRGIEYLGALPGTPTEGDLSYVIGVGRPQTRRDIAERCDGLGWTAASLIDPTALVGSNLQVGPGAVICGGVVVSTNVFLGPHVHVNPNATIGHDTAVDEYVSINPGAIVSGDVHIFSECLIGAGATVLQGLHVGNGAVVGASACVTRNVVGCSTVKGVPAR